MSKYGEEQDQLKQKLLEMSSLVERAIRLGLDAVIDRNAQAAAEVFRNEAQINRLELEVDELAVNLLTLYQPMAINLRFLVAAMKINTNLERMGDLSVNIAQTANELLTSPALPPVIDIPLMGHLVQTMVRNSIDAFVYSDTNLATAVLEADDSVDSMRTTCYQQLLPVMQSDRQLIRYGVNLLSITRTLERIADHATNVAEDVLFHVNGVDVRHGMGLGRQP